MARFTLYGIYQYDPTIFDDALTPENIDKDMLINTIFSTSGDLYPYHQVPSQLKINITYWFRRMYYNFQQSYAALTAEYSPIENYDRYENTQEDEVVSNTTASSSTANGSSTTSDDYKHNKSAYNSSTYEPVDNDVRSSSNSADSSATTNGTHKGTTGRTGTTHVHGNIGVTTAQQMINAELELRKYDLYKDIAKQFEKEFLVQVY